MHTEEQIIEGCKLGKPAAQQALYNLYAGRMIAVCTRYAKTTAEAEDIFHDAFLRVFEYINTYTSGSFEGWIRRVFVRTAINNFHKNRQHYYHLDSTIYPDLSDEEPDAISHLSNQELLELINQLPDGYRVVFNLYALEGYTHAEIAEVLGIAEGTSKSQLAKSKAALKQLIAKNFPEYAGR